MVYAYPIIGVEGTFYLQGERPHETYHRREKYKLAGATWDGKHWIVTDDQRLSLGD